MAWNFADQIHALTGFDADSTNDSETHYIVKNKIYTKRAFYKDDDYDNDNAKYYKYYCMDIFEFLIKYDCDANGRIKLKDGIESINDHCIDKLPI